MIAVFYIFLLANALLLMMIWKTTYFYNIGKLFIFYWVVNLVLGMLFFSEVSFGYESFILLLFYVDVFFISYNTIKASNNVIIPCNIKKTNNIVHKILIITLLCGFAFITIELLSNGLSLMNLLSVEGLEESGYYFTDARYGDTNEVEAPLIGQIMLMINYSGFVLAGYAFKIKFANIKYCFLQFIPMIFSTLSTTAKTGLISGLLLWISGFLVACNLNLPKNKTRKINKRMLFISCAVLFLFFFLSFAIRYQSNDTFAIVNRIFTYAFGHVPCYDDWYNRFNANLVGYSYGQQSMQMIFGSEMPQALKSEYVVPSFTTKYGWTNVNTMFAYVLMDFGYVGSTLFFMLFGLLTAIGKKSIMKFYSPIGHAILGIAFYMVLYSFLICPLKYTSIAGSFVLFGVYIKILKLFSHK